MDLLTFFLLSVFLRITEGLKVTGPSGPLVVPLGGSVLLPCSVDELLPLEDLEVDWKRSDSQTLISLYQDGDVDSFNDRAHFFTGNFSLLLKNVTTEDEGNYTCTVHSGQRSGQTVMEIKDIERLIVSGSDVSISVNVGEDVTLNCSVDSHISPEDFEEVIWRKRVEKDFITVLLYQNQETLLDASDERYIDRVEFFTDEIPRGNFSLRLKRVRTEDKGLYMCQVFAGTLSANTTVILGQLGFSSLHIIVLILCISACGSTLLFCSLIYCRTQTDRVLHLQMFLVFCPNIIMFFAFVFWGVSEESLYETVFPCALYVLKPLMLLFTAPYNRELTGTIETLCNWSLESYYFSFTTVFYSILFKSALAKSLNFTGFERIMIIVLFAIVLLLCLTFIIYLSGTISGKLSERIENIFSIVVSIIFYVLPSLQFVLLFFTFGSAKGGFFIVAVLPIITSVTRYNWNITCGDDLGCSPLVRRLVWIILMCFMNAVLIYFYIIALEKEKDRVGWACTIGFLQVIWTVWNCLVSFQDLEFTRITIVYVFGSVGVVLFSAVGLMTELILKTVNGKGLVGDLRIIVFSSESLFCVSVLIIIILSPWIKKDLPCCQIPVMCKKAAHTESVQNQTAAESHEMDLLNEPETDRRKDETQPDPV